jgi:hypothetical protein
MIMPWSINLDIIVLATYSAGLLPEVLASPAEGVDFLVLLGGRPALLCSELSVIIVLLLRGLTFLVKSGSILLLESLSCPSSSSSSSQLTYGLFCFLALNL